MAPHIKQDEPKMTESSSDIVTNMLVDFVSNLDAKSLPAPVLHETKRSMVDSIGCIVGGSNHLVVARATNTLSEFFGPPQASLLGQDRQADIFHASLINGLAGAAYSFFDSYSAAHLHAGVVHAAALLAVSERVNVSGTDFLAAYCAGLEVACRLTKAIALPPAEADIGWSIGGIVCGLSSALAAGSLLRLNRDQMTWALGIAASGAAGTRAEHGTMTAALIFGQAAQNGVRAAILAADGFTSSSASLEGAHGFTHMFSKRANIEALVETLDARYEMPLTTYKPFPTDIAIHPGIDAMLRLKAEYGFESREVVRVRVGASELAATFCDRPDPADELEAKFSLQHWVAAAATHGKAQLEQGKIDVVQDLEIKRLRAAIQVAADADLAWDATEMSVELADGRHVQTHIVHCVGSVQSPMSDDEVDAKFIAQASLAIGSDRAAQLAKMCWEVENITDVSVLAKSAC
jgi:2-methylcitrate dehydratase PrpD